MKGQSQARVTSKNVRECSPGPALHPFRLSWCPLLWWLEGWGWDPWTNFLGKNWISLSLRQKSACSRLPPLSPDIWWPPVYTNLQSFVLPSINRVVCIPWNYEGTADSIITKGRKLSKLVQTTQQMHGVMLTLLREELGGVTEAEESPFSHLPALYPEAQTASLERGEDGFLLQLPPSWSHWLWWPLRMLASCSLGRPTVRKRPS